jgi:hypothetical protein
VAGFASSPGCLIPNTEDIFIRSQLIFKKQLVSDGDDPVPKVGQSAVLAVVGTFPIRLVVVRPIAKHAHARQTVALDCAKPQAESIESRKRTSFPCR